MASVTVKWLEDEVTELKEWIANHQKQHHLYRAKTQKRSYYVAKLSQMDEYNLTTIEIKKWQ
ncbi:hypothetical protein PG913_08400 [Tenacibaculum pacificus]|uniref:hypothetical protein n=1 Tax=Tenacibaculum pacificus TaxID=3018314 RepID=UPI0022F3B4A0|nr:hypothetical protein [Tenacibaculum pacificus]WBX72922.1 hypothetical protein PG913_08400 [Tenacibaculum pacificus]